MPQQGNPRHTSLVFPILLILVGALFLFAQYRPAFDPWPILATYWPLIFVFIGVGMLYDYTRRRENPTAPQRFAVGSTFGVLAFALVLLAMILHGHGFRRGSRSIYPMQHQVHTVDLQGAKAVHTSIQMDAGGLSLSGGSSHLLDADFDHRSSWDPPQVEYKVSNGTGELTISQAESDTHVKTTADNNWNLHFGGDVPIELKVDVGAGSGNLRLRDLNVTDLELNIGAGRVEVDLTGNRKSDLQGKIEGGVGEAVIHLPRNVGVIVNATGGLGTIDARGFKNEGDDYTNDAYGKSPATIHLKVEGGVGRIKLTQEL